ncbi:hypothetical protein NX059_010395 [Plenodomus lindquistii]|nr:hypothetical protein NX059_010395 [Plenodomus lindquistii]
MDLTAEEMKELEHFLRNRRLRPTMANRDISPIACAPFGVFETHALLGAMSLVTFNRNAGSESSSEGAMWLPRLPSYPARSASSALSRSHTSPFSSMTN